MNINYQAKREIIATHTVDLFYDIDFDPQDYPRTLKSEGQENRSIGGNFQFTHWRDDVIWTITIPRVDRYNDLPEWREFLSSTSRRETFSLDPDGTSGSPSTAGPRDCVRPDGDYQERTVGPRLVEITFRAREVSPSL